MPKKETRSEMKKAAQIEPPKPPSQIQSDCPLKKKEPANPVIVLVKNAVAVKGARQTITLKADKAFSGKGTFECASDKVKFWRGAAAVAFNSTSITFDNVTESGVTVEVEALDNSTLEGVVLKWTLKEGNASGTTDTKKMTAVKATLDIYKKSGTALTAAEKAGDGRVIHKQNGAKERKRAKVTLKCEPADWPGTLILERDAENITCWTAETAGTAKTLPLEIPVGPGKTLAPLWVEGKEASAHKCDTGLQLGIKDLADRADAAAITVVETQLALYKALIRDEKKLDPGGTLVKQDDKFRRGRVRLAVRKTPKDAPCKLVLKGGANKVKLFGEANEKHADGETAVTLPKEIAAGDIADEAKGMIFWAEGAELTSLQEAVFQIDVADVEDATDKAALTVVDLRTADESEPAFKLLPVKTPVNETGEYHTLKVKLVHRLGAGTYEWTSTSTNFTLSDQTTQTVKLTAKESVSGGLDREELKVVFTPSGKKALLPVVHRLTVLKVVFAESTDNHRYGYDDMDKADNAGGQLHYVSVKKSDHTLVKTTLTGGVTGDMLTFKSEDAAKADIVAPGATAEFDLRIDGKDKDKDETEIRVWANGENNNLCAKIKVDVYKEKDLAVTVVRVHDSASPATALQLTWDKTVAQTAIRSWFKKAVATITLTDLGLKDARYDLNGDGKLTLEPGVVSAEKTVVDAAATGTGQKVIIVRDLTWIYFLKTAASAGDDTITVKDVYAGSMKFVEVGHQYELGTGANAETITVQSKAGTTITLDDELQNDHPTTEGLMWPLLGLSGNPIYVREAGASERVVRETIGHEVGHSLLNYLDVNARECLMHFDDSNTDTRLRRKESRREYDPGNEDQWQTVVR